MKKYLLSLCLAICVLAIAAIPYRSQHLKRDLTTELDSPLLPANPFIYDVFAQLLPPHFFMDSSIFGNFYFPNGDTILPISVPGHVETLGRVLFYDKQLSINNSVSCATCHIQSVAFADTLALSMGFDGSLGERNSIGLSNVFSPSMRHFFWDAGTDTMSTQIKLALESEVEMGMNEDSLIARIQSTSFYPQLYADAFGSPSITIDRTVGAIRSFVLSMFTMRSKYDIGRIGVDSPIDHFATFSSLENQGKDLFFGLIGEAKCIQCHSGEMFSSREVASNGLDTNPTDLGFGAISNLAKDHGTFRAPSLRNIGLTAPYMHDGRFETLEEVVEHYSTGVQPHANLHPLLKEQQTQQPVQLNLSDTEKQALVAFLHTLTDSSFIRDVRWSNPFDPNPDVDTIDVNSFPLSVDPEPLAAGLQVSPNPSRQSMLFEIESGGEGVQKLQLFSLSGQLIYQKEFRGEAVRWEHKQLSVPAGIYLARVESAGQIFVKKVQVE